GAPPERPHVLVLREDAQRLSVRVRLGRPRGRRLHLAAHDLRPDQRVGPPSASIRRRTASPNAGEEMSKGVPEGKFVDIGDGLQIHYQEMGAGKNALVFLHGSGPGASGYSNFRRNYPFFAERGFRTIVPDTLGYGYSSKPEVDYTLDFLVGGL